MRLPKPLLIAALLVALSACQCGPDAPTAVQFVLTNTGSNALYVDASDGRMGLVVKRRVGGEWRPFVETPACECLSCELVCGGCDCDGLEPAPRVMKLGPGETFERVWEGQVQQSGTGSCSGAFIQGPACLRAENPPLDETFQLELCWAPSSNGGEGAPSMEVVPGSLPAKSTLCIERPFTVADGRVEIGPEQGRSCSTHAECTGAEELCFSGACTRACPESGFPELGGTWQLRIPEPDDQGFFTHKTEGALTTSSGSGTVGSVRYENGTMTVTLRRQLPGGGAAIGTLYVTIPGGVAAPLTVGEPIAVTVVDASSDQNPDHRAVVVRDGAGTLLLAADTAQGGRILTDAQIAPFSLSRTGEGPVGCRHTACGKRLDHKTRFAHGEQAVSLSPGEAADWVAGGQTWKLLNVANGRYAESVCALGDLMPWVVVNQRSGPGGP